MKLILDSFPGQRVTLDQIKTEYLKGSYVTAIVLVLVSLLLGGFMAGMAIMELVKSLIQGSFSLDMLLYPLPLVFGGFLIYFGISITIAAITDRKVPTQMIVRECRCTGFEQECRPEMDGDRYCLFVDEEGQQQEYPVPERLVKPIAGQECWLVYPGEQAQPIRLFLKATWQRTEDGFIGRSRD